MSAHADPIAEAASVEIPELAATLNRALAFPAVRVIVRAAGGAIAEVQGELSVAPPKPEQSWLRIGEESASHVHLDTRAVRRVRLVKPEGRNAALEVLDAEASPLLRLSFGGTNPGSPERYRADRLEAVDNAFGYLRDPEGA